MGALSIAREIPSKHPLPILDINHQSRPRARGCHPSYRPEEPRRTLEGGSAASQMIGLLFPLKSMESVLALHHPSALDRLVGLPLSFTLVASWLLSNPLHTRLTSGTTSAVCILSGGVGDDDLLNLEDLSKGWLCFQCWGRPRVHFRRPYTQPFITPFSLPSPTRLTPRDFDLIHANLIRPDNL